MGKTRDLSKKIRNTKGTFHANMGTVKDRHGLDLTEVGNIGKRRDSPVSFLFFFNFILFLNLT